MNLNKRVTKKLSLTLLGLILTAINSLHSESLESFQKLSGLGLEMIEVQAGSFMMGYDLPDDYVAAKWDLHEHTGKHKVIITKNFMLGKYEVKRSEFEVFVKETAYLTSEEKEPTKRTLEKKNKNLGRTWKTSFQGQNLPVNCVSATDAYAFCDWLNKKHAKELPEGYVFRLPTDAEWEYACRAGETSEAYGPLDEIGWFESNSHGQPHPVGTKKPNAWGFYDMLGNQLEFCADKVDRIKIGNESRFGTGTFKDNIVDPYSAGLGKKSIRSIHRGTSWGVWGKGKGNTDMLISYRGNIHSQVCGYQNGGFRLALGPVLKESK